MSNNNDDFADIIYNDKATGVFGSTEAALDNGFQSFLQVETAAMPDGIAFEFRCEGCHAHPRLTIDYPEAIAIKYGLSPEKAYAHNVPILTPQGPHGSARQLCANPTSWSWRKPENAWGLNQRCTQCNWHLTVRVKPQELEALLRKAVSEGYLQTPQCQAANVHCQLMRQQPRR